MTTAQLPVNVFPCHDRGMQIAYATEVYSGTMRLFLDYVQLLYVTPPHPHMLRAKVGYMLNTWFVFVKKGG